MRKKTIKAARSKRISPYALLFLVFSVFIGLYFTYTANANFSTWVPAPAPIYDKPSITLVMPKDYIETGNQTTILFTVTMPSTWESSLVVDGPSSLWGTIRNATCYLDQEQILFNDTAYGRDAKPVTVDGTVVYPKNYPISINYSCDLSQVSSGFHNLTVSVSADTFCQNWETIINGYHYPCNYYQDVSTNETFTFNVAAQITPSPIPTPTSSPSPTPSPTIEPTLRPTQTSIPTPSAENNQKGDFTLPIILAAVIVVAVALGVLAYFRRRKL